MYSYTYTDYNSLCFLIIRFLRMNVNMFVYILSFPDDKRYLKSFLMQGNNYFILSNNCHGWGRLSDTGSWGCYTNFARALQNNLAKIHNARNQIYAENFKLILCTCAQSMVLDIRTKCQLEILIRCTISAIHTLWENILESSWNVSETTQAHQTQWCWPRYSRIFWQQDQGL